MTIMERLNSYAKKLEEENYHTEAELMREASTALSEAELLLREAHRHLKIQAS